MNEELNNRPDLTSQRPLARGIREAAELVGVSPGFVRKAIAAGELQRVRLGRRVLIREEELVNWLDRNKG